jgi:arginine utilization protein RocB
MQTWYQQTQSLTLRLTRSFSQTDTDSETQFAGDLMGLLVEWPYFRDHPDCLRVERTRDDPRERSVL